MAEIAQISGVNYRRHQRQQPTLNWLEAIFSFFFGDGNPNADLEDERWHQIGQIIRQHQGAIAAEHVAPYLDEIDRYIQLEDEDYILPILTRFNGRPHVTDSGNLIYQFPDLQVTVDEPWNHPQSITRPI